MPTRKQPERVHESNEVVDYVLPEIPKKYKVIKKKKGKVFKNLFKSKKKVVVPKSKKK